VLALEETDPAKLADEEVEAAPALFTEEDIFNGSEDLSLSILSIIFAL